jgi:hypothetical protein
VHVVHCIVQKNVARLGSTLVSEPSVEQELAIPLPPENRRVDNIDLSAVE